MNQEALAYQSFMASYSSMGGKSDFSASCDAIAQSDMIIVLGGRVSCDNEAVYDAVVNASNNGAKVIYMHPIEDVLMDGIITQMVKYEAGSEEGVVAMLAKTLLDGCETSDAIQQFLDDLDEGYLCAESNVGDEEFGLIFETAAVSPKKTLVVGLDLFNHKNSSNIAKLCGVIDSVSTFSVVIAPNSEANSVEMLDVREKGVLDPVSPLPEYNGTIVYQCYPNKQSNNDTLLGSAQFAVAARLNSGERVTIDGYDGTKTFVVDETLKGTIALNVLHEESNCGYRFEKIKLMRVGS
ncbi:MAG: hypothetical protein Q8S36_09490 [Sulfuricurvum sp.]|nr:hypothetical protein [Sulfuricurvum sp.]